MKEVWKQFQANQQQFTKTFFKIFRFLQTITECEKVMYLVVSVCLLFCLSVCSHVLATKRLAFD